MVDLLECQLDSSEGHPARIPKRVLFKSRNASSIHLSLEHCLDDDSPLVPSTRYLLRLAAAAQWRGLVTGIRWGLPPSMQIAIDDAIRRKDWGAKNQGGGDPTHV